MEGKEVRFGIANSIIWSTATTAASNGSVNAMHSSLTPLAGGVALFNMMLGEIIFGGVGAGMYGFLLFVIMTVFLAGLWSGERPSIWGKRSRQARSRCHCRYSGTQCSNTDRCRLRLRTADRAVESGQWRTPRPERDSLRLCLRCRE